MGWIYDHIGPRMFGAHEVKSLIALDMPIEIEVGALWGA